MTTGNQHRGRRVSLLALLDRARECLRRGLIPGARAWLRLYHVGYQAAPASTRRRWRCGR